jgi:hypothetical protein
MAKKNIEKKLYAFLPEECEESGVNTGGWGCRLVPAFDPDKVDVDKIEKPFGKNRSLFQFVGDAINYFKPRKTGPDNGYHGIYASTERIDSKYLKKIR